MQRARKDPQGLMPAQEDLDIKISNSIFIIKLYSINNFFMISQCLCYGKDVLHLFHTQDQFFSIL